MPRITDAVAWLAAGVMALSALPAWAQDAGAGRGGDAKPAAKAGDKGADMPTVGGWPKISFDTLASLEYAGLRAPGGRSRGPDLNLRSDSTFLAEFNDTLSL